MDPVNNNLSTQSAGFPSGQPYPTPDENNVAEDVNQILAYFTSLSQNQAQPDAIHELGVWINQLKTWLPALQQSTMPFDKAMASSASQVLEDLQTPIGREDYNSLYSAAGNDKLMSSLVNELFQDPLYASSVRLMNEDMHDFTNVYPYPVPPLPGENDSSS